MPFSQGMKIIAVGTTRAIYAASCPAPETISRWLYSFSAAAVRTASTQAWSNLTAGESQTCSTLISSLSSPAIRSSAALTSVSMAATTSSSGWRRSMVKKTSPGRMLRLFGLTSISPTVETASGGWSSATLLIASTIREAPTSASRRRCIGVVPAWLSKPVTVTSYQRMP